MSRARGGPYDRGAGSVLVLGIVAALVAACLAVVAAAGDRLDGARAQAAADAGALAGARHLRAAAARGDPPGGGCAVATEAVGRAMPLARTGRCVEGPGLRVEVEVTVRGRLAVAAAASGVG